MSRSGVDRPLRLGGVPEHFNLPWHLALESGRLSDLDLSWSDQPGGTGQLIDELERGSLDVVSILTEGTVAAIDQGLDAVIVQVYVASPLQWGVFVPARSGLIDVTELEGRPIAISRLRSGSHLMAFVQAQRRRWRLEPEQFVVVGGLVGARTAFAEGRAEVFLWDQYMTRPLVEAGEFRQVGVEETPWPSFVIAARTEVLTGRTTEVGRVVDAVVAKAAGLHRRPGVATEVARRYGLTVDTASRWLRSTEFAPRGPYDTSVSDDVRAILADAGILGR